MKRYRYKGKVYCEKDLSETIENYGGDLYDLYFELKRDGKAAEQTLYFNPYDFEEYYESHEELIEKEFGSLEVKEND